MIKTDSTIRESTFQIVLVSAVLVLSIAAVNPIDSFAQTDNQDLGAELFLHDTAQSNELILESYHAPDGSYNPTGAEYPEEPNFELQNGTIIGVRSTSQNFTVFPVDVRFYDVNEEKWDAEPISNNQWKVSVPAPGVYNLFVTTEYTPSNDNTAYFIDTVTIK